jgi:hypothetical protein
MLYSDVLYVGGGFRGLLGSSKPTNLFCMFAWDGPALLRAGAFPFSTSPKSIVGFFSLGGSLFERTSDLRALSLGLVRGGPAEFSPLPEAKPDFIASESTKERFSLTMEAKSLEMTGLTSDGSGWSRPDDDASSTPLASLELLPFGTMVIEFSRSSSVRLSLFVIVVVVVVVVDVSFLSTAPPTEGEPATVTMAA